MSKFIYINCPEQQFSKLYTKLLKIGEVAEDSETRLEMNNLFVKMCDPYVPMDTGALSQSVEVTPEYVRYTQPYAHYQYTGDVYGPNIPIIENGIIVGWWSPPGQKKHPTGASLNYSTEKHPLATSEWDKAMLRDKGDEFKAQTKAIVLRRARDKYGLKARLASVWRRLSGR